MTDRFHVKYSKEALDDLRNIYTYIAYQLLARETAKKLVNKIRSEVRLLSNFPEKHKKIDWEPWASKHIRRKPVENYIIYYLVHHEQGTISIVRIIYSARDVKRLIQENAETSNP